MARWSLPPRVNHFGSESQQTCEIQRVRVVDDTLLVIMTSKQCWARFIHTLTTTAPPCTAAAPVPVTTATSNSGVAIIGCYYLHFLMVLYVLVNNSFTLIFYHDSIIVPLFRFRYQYRLKIVCY
jgi:hypothetical protein